MQSEEIRANADTKESLTNVVRRRVTDSGSSRLRVVKKTGPEKVDPGEIVSYELTIDNLSNVGIPGVRLLEMLPIDFRLKKGSVQLNGFSAPDPGLSSDGKVFTFTVGDLAPATSATLFFMVEVAAGSAPGKVVNVATAISSDGGKSNIAKEVVIVRDGPQQSKKPENSSLAALMVTGSVAAALATEAGTIAASAVVPPVAEAGKVVPAAVPPAAEADKIVPAAAAPPAAEADKVVPAAVPPAAEADKVVPAAAPPAAEADKVVPAAAPPAVEADKVVPAAAPPAVEADKVVPAAAPPAVEADKVVPAAAPPVTEADKITPPAAIPPAVEADKVVPAAAVPPAAETEKVVSAAVAPPVTDKIASPTAATSAQATAPSPDSSSQPLPQTAAPDNETPRRMGGSFAVPETRNLAELIGRTDISVLADVDGQYVKNMAENQILENEVAGLVEETSLLASIYSGRSYSRESRAALARTEQAKAQTLQALGSLLPSVLVRFSNGFETSAPSAALDESGNSISSETHTRTDAALTVRQPLFDLPNFMDWRRRKVIEQARGENYRVSDGDAYVSAANAYITLVSTRLQTDMTREFETQLADLFSYVEKRASAGAASVSDMARVRARSQATLSSRLEQESAHAAAGIEFVRLTNLVPRKVRLPELEDLGASLVPQSLDLAVIKAMKSNPEITALAAELRAAEIDKSAAKGRYLPRVDAEYTDSFSLHAGGEPSNSGQRDKRIMAVLNWTIFSGGSDYNVNVERTARHKELQYRLDDQRRRVVQTLSANYATLAATRERITAGYQELKSISTAAEAMSKRMLSGNQSLLDLLDVYDRFYQVRSRLVSLHMLEMSTVAQLVRLTLGTPGAIKTEPAATGMGKDEPAPFAHNNGQEY